MKNVKLRMQRRRGRIRGFTLLELMMVVGIIGLISAMSVPAILSVTHEEPLRKAVNDTVEILTHARAEAILSGQMTEVTFHPLTREVSFVGGKSSAPPPRIGHASVGSTQYDAGVDIAMLDINLMDFGASPVAYVRFFPNGTCDELTMVLHSGDQWRKITLEPTTALASVGLVNK
ncbi:MAG: prepilin-type N-terminal cleavage/methylation domain-containing protein [Limisphaerales bacterium]